MNGVLLDETSELDRTPSAGTPAREVATSLFRVVWRWHFYAGVIVAPFLMVVALTGGLYLFSAEIMDFAQADLLFVEPVGGRVALDTQVSTVLERFPEDSLNQVQIAADRTRSTRVVLQSGAASEAGPAGRRDVFVNPYTGDVIGDRTERSLAVFFEVVLEIHRTFLAGTTGRIICEIVTSWTLILVVTGLYLWWPRRREKVKGVWVPRWGGKLYVVVRDCHALAGVFLFPLIILIASTGLFYTVVWGESFHFVSSRFVDATPPAVEPGDVAEADAASPRLHPKVSLDEAAAIAKSRYGDRDLGISLPQETRTTYEVFAVNDYARGTWGPMKSTLLQIDAQTGVISGVDDLSQSPRYWWHTWTYPLHVGSIGGIATKLLWLVASLVLMALPLTGLWMWWKRRPRGKSGFPRRPTAKLPAWVWCLLLFVGLLLPIAGISLLLIGLLDRTLVTRHADRRLALRRRRNPA